MISTSKNIDRQTISKAIITYVDYIIKYADDIVREKDEFHDDEVFMQNYKNYIKNVETNKEVYINDKNLITNQEKKTFFSTFTGLPNLSNLKNQSRKNFTFVDKLYNQMLNNPKSEEVNDVIQAIKIIEVMLDSGETAGPSVNTFSNEIGQLNEKLENYARDKEKIQSTELGVESLIEKGEDFGKEKGEDFGKEKEIKPDPEKIELSRKITEEPGQKNFMNKISQASSALFNVISRCLKLLLTLIKNKLMSGVDKFTKLFAKKEEKGEELSK